MFSSLAGKPSPALPQIQVRTIWSTRSIKPTRAHVHAATEASSSAVPLPAVGLSVPMAAASTCPRLFSCTPQDSMATRISTGWGTNCGVKVKCPGTQNCQKEGECPLHGFRNMAKALSVESWNTENHQRLLPATTSTPPPSVLDLLSQGLKPLLRDLSSFAYKKSGQFPGNKKQLRSPYCGEV